MNIFCFFVGWWTGSVNPGSFVLITETESRLFSNGDCQMNLQNVQKQCRLKKQQNKINQNYELLRSKTFRAAQNFTADFHVLTSVSFCCLGTKKSNKNTFHLMKHLKSQTGREPDKHRLGQMDTTFVVAIFFCIFFIFNKNIYNLL